MCRYFCTSFPTEVILWKRPDSFYRFESQASSFSLFSSKLEATKESLTDPYLPVTQHVLRHRGLLACHTYAHALLCRTTSPRKIGHIFKSLHNSYHTIIELLPLKEGTLLQKYISVSYLNESYVKYTWSTYEIPIFSGHGVKALVVDCVTTTGSPDKFGIGYKCFYKVRWLTHIIGVKCSKARIELTLQVTIDIDELGVPNFPGHPVLLVLCSASCFHLISRWVQCNIANKIC